MVRILVGIFLLVTVYNVQGQDVMGDKLVWKVNQLHNQSSGQDSDYQCSFTTEGEQDITWLQKNGQYSTTLNVTGVSGSWTDINLTGTIIYSISSGPETGTLTFERTSVGVFIRINLTQGTAPHLDCKFSVSEVIASNQ